jgi:hypothetical protein
MILVSVPVLDRHRFDADPDPNPNFHFDADPGPYPDWQQYDADPQADRSSNFTHDKTFFFFSLLLFTAMPVYNVFFFQW